MSIVIGRFLQGNSEENPQAWACTRACDLVFAVLLFSMLFVYAVAVAAPGSGMDQPG
jgi:hypothetical protein